MTAKVAVNHLPRSAWIHKHVIAPNEQNLPCRRKKDFFSKPTPLDRKSTRLNSSHLVISYAVFCLKKKKRIPGQPFLRSSQPPARSISPPRVRHSTSFLFWRGDRCLDLLVIGLCGTLLHYPGTGQ